MTKTMVENKWALWSYKPFKNYPSTWYFWINPDGVVKYCRSVEPLGFMPVQLDIDLWIDKNINTKEMKKLGCKKIYRKISQERLSMGWFY